MTAEKGMSNKKELVSIMQTWRERLNLTDWDVKLNTVNNLEARGQVDYVECRKEAEITILVPAGTPVTTIIHELLYIKFSLLDDTGSDLQSRIIHQIIHDLAVGYTKTTGEK